MSRQVTWRGLALALGLALSLGSAAGWSATPEEEAKAAALFQKSAVHYREGRFDEAVALLREAYDLVGEPVLLYNLARAYEGKGDRQEAIEAYRRYLALSDEAKAEVKDRGAIEQRIQTLEAQLAEREALAREREAADERAAKASAEEAKARAAARDREPTTASPYPWIVVGVGGATLVVSGVLAGVAKSREAAAKDDPEHRSASETLAAAETFATGTNVTLAVGGAVLVAGLAWGIADLLLIDDGDTTLSLRLSPRQASLSLAFP
ncbi:MAG: tetratricopeptide repeat protein [Myxococcales bacterium]|nr:tetratricopeptide repeat protein [Myxococcales bacterium]